MTKNDELRKYYSSKLLDMRKKFVTYPEDKKIEVMLALLKISNLRLNTLEKMKNPKMGEWRKKILEDYINSLQQEIWIYEYQTSNYFNKISLIDPKKHKIEKKIKDADIFDWSHGVPDIQTDMTATEEFCSLPPEKKIEILFIKLSLLNTQYIAVKKNQEKLFKIPNFKEYEKILSEHHLRHLKAKRFPLYKYIHWLYFAELPKDYPQRKAIKKRILGRKRVFDYRIIQPMLLYEDEDRSVSINLETIVDYRGEMQNIIDVLRWYPLNRINLEIIAEKNPNVKKILESIPKEVIDQRREILEEVLKAKIRDYRLDHY